MRLFHLLSQKAFCVCELEVLLEMSQSNVSRHLNKLRLAGLITPLKEGLWVHYQISDAFKANSPELLCYLEKHWAQENLFKSDLEKYNKYKKMGLSCKDITEDIERVLVAIQ
jgi:ArsR family transcriptional regulator